MKPLYLDWNLGLGDAIICNGLVRWRARDRSLIVPSWKHNLPTVTHMFSDLKNVTVQLPANGDARPLETSKYDILSIGINARGSGQVEPWDRAFYVFAGVPFEAKWDSFHVPISGTELRAFDAVLFHEDGARGFKIPDERIVENSNSWVTAKFPVVEIDARAALLTDWRYVIQSAVEIHCIDSSVMHLAELLPTTGRLFYHKYARAKGNRNHQDAVFNKKWTVIE